MEEKTHPKRDSRDAQSSHAAAHGRGAAGARGSKGGEQTLPFSEARAYYDRFGAKQDSQAFYEDPPLEEMIAHSGFEEARAIFEFGCGTGRLAARLLERHASPTATYLGCDLSPVMVSLARQRLEMFADRATVVLSEGGVRFPISDRSADRVVSSYVLDLLSYEEIGEFFREAHRVLRAGGRLSLVGLAHGTTLPSRVVTSLWTAVFRLRPSLVGGCRPLRLDPFLDQAYWQIERRQILAPFGVASEVLILTRRDMQG